ncbi:SDR family NAD(P)-dependent oxidoreductase [Brevibacillus sp. NRS-1366]|uniref:SDR family NAD(P)-dependent oxidoreductase n=1 Tax=Brevibacillus sp. NRS-1366 TaxID=3233899 RepID=UPI003D1F2743
MNKSVETLIVVSLSPRSLELKSKISKMISHNEGRVYVLDCSGDEQTEAWDTWVVNATKQMILSMKEDAIAGWSGPIVTILKISSNADDFRRGLELAAVESIRGVSGSVALERAREGVLSNLVIINDQTCDHDVHLTVNHLLDKRYNGYITGATLRLTTIFHSQTVSDKPEQQRFKGRVLITGAGGNIGFATAQAFARAGYQPILSDMNEEILKQRSAELGGAEILVLDVTDRKRLREKVKEGVLGNTLSAVILVHGYQGAGELVNLEEEKIDRSIAINATSVLGMIEELTPLLTEGSAVSVVSSQAGIKAFENCAAYSGPKFALLGLIQGLASYLGKKGISFNCLCPGDTDTTFLRAYFERLATLQGVDFNTIYNSRAKEVPVGRFARPEEMGEALRFLAQLDSTGVVLAPTGGYTLT